MPQPSRPHRSTTDHDTLHRRPVALAAALTSLLAWMPPAQAQTQPQRVEVTGTPAAPDSTVAQDITVFLRALE